MLINLKNKYKIKKGTEIDCPLTFENLYYLAKISLLYCSAPSD